MLASTMQHSTHHHTPNPTGTTTPTPQREALGHPDQEAAPKKHQPGCLLRTQQCAKPTTCLNQKWFCVPPSHTHHNPSTRLLRSCSVSMESWKGEPTTFRVAGHLTTRWDSLERRWSSRTFRYGYLVTTSSQSPVPPSTTPSLTG